MARVAIIVDEQFEDSEFQVPYDALKQAKHDVVVVGIERGKELTGKRGDARVTTDRAVREVSAAEFDTLVIPGGHSPDKLRLDPRMVGFTRELVLAGKPVAAICHAGSLLIEARVTDGRTLTSWPSIKTDLVNAGAHWVNQEVVEDGNLITSRKPEDLPAFCATLLRTLEREDIMRGTPPRT